MYRSDLEPLVGGMVELVTVSDGRFVRPRHADPAIFDALAGAQLAGTRRHGKLLLADFAEPEVVLGIRFGMTGRLLIDGASSIEQLEYSSARDEPAWDRFELRISGHRVAVRDQRCLGSVELDPDLSSLAPDAATVSPEVLEQAFARRTKAVKAALLDQNILAGLGNLLADEALWSAGIAPATPVDDLSARQLGALAESISGTIDRLTETGGSNTGESFAVRSSGALCPRCDGSMQRSRIGGRTSWWCSSHQV